MAVCSSQSRHPEVVDHRKVLKEAGILREDVQNLTVSVPDRLSHRTRARTPSTTAAKSTAESATATSNTASAVSWTDLGRVVRINRMGQAEALVML